MFLRVCRSAKSKSLMFSVQLIIHCHFSEQLSRLTSTRTRLLPPIASLADPPFARAWLKVIIMVVIAVVVSLECQVQTQKLSIYQACGLRRARLALEKKATLQFFFSNPHFLNLPIIESNLFWHLAKELGEIFLSISTSQFSTQFPFPQVSSKNRDST